LIELLPDKDEKIKTFNMIEQQHNHKEVVINAINGMANTQKVKEILKNFPDDKRREYVGQMKKQIVASWYVNNCKECSQEFSNTLTDWENGKFD